MSPKKTRHDEEEKTQPKRSTLSEKLLIPRHKTTEFQVSRPGAGVKGMLRSSTLEEPLGEAASPMDTRKKNEMMGILYLAFSLLLLAGLGMEKAGEEASRLTQMLNSFMELNGIGPFFISAFAAWCGVCRLKGRVVFENEMQMLAFPVLYLSFIGSVASFFGPGGDHAGPGGIVGNYIYWYMQPILGVVGSRIVLTTTFLVSVMQVADIYASDVLKTTGQAMVVLGQGLKTGSLFSLKGVWNLVLKTHAVLVALIQDLIILAENGLRSVRENVFEPQTEAQESPTEEASKVVMAPRVETPKVETAKVEEAVVPQVISMPVDKDDWFPQISAFLVPEVVEEEVIEEALEETVAASFEEEVPASPVVHVLPAPRELKTRTETLHDQDGMRVATVIEDDIEDAQWEAMEAIAEEVMPARQEAFETVADEESGSFEVASEEEMEDTLVTASMEEETEEPVFSGYEEEAPVAGTGFSMDSAEEEEWEEDPEALAAFSKTLEIEPSEEEPLQKTLYQEHPEVYSAMDEDGWEEELHKELPAADFLAQPPAELIGDTEDELWERGSLLIKALDNYKVNALLESFVQGPTITRFELKPAAGTKLSKIVNLTNEIAMALAAKSVRIEAPIPGTSKVGIEIPNANPVPVYYSEIISNIKGEGKDDLHPLTIAFGKNIAGDPVIGNLAKMPHLLVAGATGAGKSVCVNTIISSILFRARPDEVKFVMIDPKQVELAVYRGIPHLITDVVTAPEEASAALMWGVEEMERRYTLLSHFGVRHIDNFNIKVREGTLEPIEEVEEIPTETLPYVVIIVDELADLMMVAKKDVETSICRIAQKARAVGIHLVIATQRPSVDVITGLIKANLPSRIAFMVKSAIDSRTILDQMGAELLLGRGDMLYYPGGQPKPERVQGAFMNDDEVAELVKRIKKTFGEGEYQDIISPFLEKEEEASDDSADFYDDKFNLALEVAIREGFVSTSMLQRHLGIGYNRAARIVDVMFARGICGTQESGKKRKVLISLAELDQYTI